jgi:hypothetical protein
MRRTALAIRCVPRYGYENTEVRTVDLDVPRDAEEDVLRDALTFYFASRGIADAVYDIAVDDYGFFAVINDEVYDLQWGTPLV